MFNNFDQLAYEVNEVKRWKEICKYSFKLSNFYMYLIVTFLFFKYSIIVYLSKFLQDALSNSLILNICS